MHLDRYAKMLLEEDKLIAYKQELKASRELLQAYEREALESKALISKLLAEAEDSRQREKMLQEQLREQSELTKSAVEQLQTAVQREREEKLLKEQRNFELKLTQQSQEAINRMKEVFDAQIKELTPKPVVKKAIPVKKKKK